MGARLLQAASEHEACSDTSFRWIESHFWSASQKLPVTRLPTLVSEKGGDSQCSSPESGSRWRQAWRSAPSPISRGTLNFHPVRHLPTSAHTLFSPSTIIISNRGNTLFTSLPDIITCSSSVYLTSCLISSSVQRQTNCYQRHCSSSPRTF